MSATPCFRIGVLGAGQLALMLAQAGQRLGVEVVCAGQPGDCAGAVAKLEQVDLDDARKLLLHSRSWSIWSQWKARTFERKFSKG